MNARVAVVLLPKRVLVARFGRFTGSFRCSLERRLDLVEGEAREEIGRSLSEISDEIALGSATAFIALAPPLARCRVVRPPDVRWSRVEALLRRNVSRYFPVLGRYAVGVTRPIRPGGGRAFETVVAACVEDSLLDAVCSGVRDAGLEVGAVVPASPALVEGLRASGRLPTEEAHVVRVRSDGWTEALLIEAGGLSGIFPLAGQAGPSERMDGPSPGDISLTDLSATDLGPGTETPGPGAVWEAIRRSVSWEDDTPGGSGPCSDTDGWTPGLMTALGMITRVAALPRLRSEESAMRERKLERRRASGLAAAVVLLLVSSALVHLWGLSREIRELEERRASIAPVVGRALEARNAVRSVVETLQTLDSLRTGASGPARAIRAVAEAVPAEGHLHRLRVRGDTLWLEGEGMEPIRAASAVATHPLVSSASPVLEGGGFTGSSTFRIRALGNVSPPTSDSSEGEGS